MAFSMSFFPGGLWAVRLTYIFSVRFLFTRFFLPVLAVSLSKPLTSVFRALSIQLMECFSPNNAVTVTFWFPVQNSILIVFLQKKKTDRNNLGVKCLLWFTVSEYWCLSWWQGTRGGSMCSGGNMELIPLCHQEPESKESPGTMGGAIAVKTPHC